MGALRASELDTCGMIGVGSVYSLYKHGIIVITSYSIHYTKLYELDWSPLHDNYGIFPMIVGSFLVTMLALVFSIPLGVGCAIFLAELAPKKVQNILRPSIEILTAIPSVVYGFVGMVLLVPLIRDVFNTNPGYSWLARNNFV